MDTEMVMENSSTMARMNAIEAKHNALESSVAAEQSRPQPNTLLLQRLKREKLKLKDELVRYEGLRRTLNRGLAS